MEKNTSLVKAINKNVRTSPRKLALVCNFIKGKKADIAFNDAYGDSIGVPPYKNFFAGGKTCLLK